MDKVKISIVVPVYNSEEYLDRCLHSVLDQDFSSYEVILVDDGSTDSSSLICDRYSSTDPRFITIHQANKGVSAARNAGINMAQGEYVMFLDSDDVLLPYALDSMVESLSGEDLVVGGYGIYIGGVPSREVRPHESVSYKGDDYPRFFQENLLPNCELLDAPWAKMFRLKAVKNLRFMEDMDYAEDKLYVFEFLSKCTSIKTVATAVYGYYLRPGSLGSDISSDIHIQKLIQFLQRYVPVINVLKERCTSVEKVQSLYHTDVVGRYLCRIMNIFATRESGMLNKATILWIYSMMDKDDRLGLFSLRAGQILNILLYKRRSVRTTVKTYKRLVKLRKLFCRKK